MHAAVIGPCPACLALLALLVAALGLRIVVQRGKILSVLHHNRGLAVVLGKYLVVGVVLVLLVLEELLLLQMLLPLLVHLLLNIHVVLGASSLLLLRVQQQVLVRAMLGWSVVRALRRLVGPLVVSLAHGIDNHVLHVVVDG